MEAGTDSNYFDKNNRTLREKNSHYNYNTSIFFVYLAFLVIKT